MANPLHNLEDALKALDDMAMVTSAGAYVKVDDVKKLMRERAASTEIEEEALPKPKDMTSAKQMILKDEELMKNFPPRKPTPGKAIPAAEPQPSSRT